MGGIMMAMETRNVFLLILMATLMVNIYGMYMLYKVINGKGGSALDRDRSAMFCLLLMSEIVGWFSIEKNQAGGQTDLHLMHMVVAVIFTGFSLYDKFSREVDFYQPWVVMAPGTIQAIWCLYFYFVYGRGAA